MARRVIALLGQPIVNEDGVAAAAITPGHLVDGVTSIAVHAVAGGLCPRTFALERDEMGKDIDTAYAAGDTVKVGAFCQGQRVNAWIASGQNISANAHLESAGDGTLRVYASGQILARALEAVDASAVTRARLRVEIM